MLTPALWADAAAHLTLTVLDHEDAPIEGATVQQAAGALLGRTDSHGQTTFSCELPCRVRVEAAGFAGASFTLTANTTVHLERAGQSETVTVTAFRAPLGALESPATSRVLTGETLKTTAAVTLDGEVRQLPGVELFRRSSSLVANPTSQGISVRGLGSTSASRTLVTADEVPLNDAIGGWIHWQEMPELALSSVELVRGGASDLYGSSAIGGVLSVQTLRPKSDALVIRTSEGGEATFDESARAEVKRGTWGALAAGGLLRTDGYIQQAPWQRGPVDIASNVHSQSGLALVERQRGGLRVFARANGMNEARSNGTAYQTNGARLWRYATGGDWHGARGEAAALRLYGSTEHYRQGFSSISNQPVFGDADCSYRCGETPTRFAWIPVNELGGALHATRPIGTGLVLLGGADVRDVRFWDREQTFGAQGQLTQTVDHQRDAGVWAEALWRHNAWTVTAAARGDWFENFDGRAMANAGAGWTAAATQPPERDEMLFDPRLGAVRRLGTHWAVSGTGFRAFRAPTPSELYRSTQVGNKLTLPNGLLESERATGAEAGVASVWAWGTVRASYFMTQVNRPIVAVTTNPTSSPILLQRENLGQIESRGVALDFDVLPLRWLAVDGGYQYAHATVTRGSQDVGNWIPAVARNMATLNLRASERRLGTLRVQSRLSGRQFDDDANAYLLHEFFRVDAYGERALGTRVTVFAAGENLLDRQIEVAKTPTTTLGMRRVARVGLELRLGGVER